MDVFNKLKPDEAHAETLLRGQTCGCAEPGCDKQHGGGDTVILIPYETDLLACGLAFCEKHARARGAILEAIHNGR